jgi:hypothetical protein
VWQLSSRAFRWSALPACADCCFLRLCLWFPLPARADRFILRLFRLSCLLTCVKRF